MKSWLQKCLLVLLLLALGLGTRFLLIGRPADVVWDEQHFGRFTKGYFEGKYFFDIHPPLGKFLLFGALKLAGADPGTFDFAIGTPYPSDYPWRAARFLPALFGGLLPLVVYALARMLRLSRRASFFAGALVVFDNAVFAESHFALIDIFVPFFGYLGLLCFLKHRGAEPFSFRWWAWLALATLGGALAVSVKWTGGGMLVVMAVATVIESVERRSWKMFVSRALVLGSLSILLYVSLFALHFRILASSGTGDDFMSERFKASLRGTAAERRGDLEPLGFWGKFLELNTQMFGVNANQSLTHPDSSRFHEWLVGRKKIYLWVDREDSQKQIYLAPNPVVWLFGSTLFFGGVLFLALRHRALRELLTTHPEWRERIFALEFLTLVYLINWLPFAAITRAMFLYHYFTALIASLLLGSFLLFDLAPALGVWGAPPTARTVSRRYLFWSILMLAAIGFVLLSPLSYGFRVIIR